MKEEEIKNFIATDINIHLKKYYDRYKNDLHRREGLLKVVDKELVEFAEEIKVLAEDRLGRKLHDRFIYATSLHFSALFNRISKNNVIFSTNIKLPPSINTKEYEVAKEIHKLIEDRYKLSIPEMEIEYLALLLTSIQEASHQERVGIVVAAHGTSTATSMVAVAKKLFDADNIAAVDMPLERTPSDILECVIEKVQQVDEGKGVLLLVDMGSLNSVGEVITDRTKIDTKSIDMVSTPLVLEAVRKCSLCDADLNSVYTYLCADFRGYTSNIVSEVSIENGNQNAIITICSTGKGAAMKLKELVEAATKNITGNNNIEVIPCGLKELKKVVKEVGQTSNVISLVGISNPKLGIPFVSIEALIDGSGEEILRNIIRGKDIRIANKSEKQIVLKNLCKQTLVEFLTFLNPEKIYSLLEEFVNSIENSLNVQYSNPTKLRIMIHLACALERMLLNSGLNYDTTDVNFDKKVLNALMETKSIFESALSITLTDEEIYHMVDIISEN